MNRIEFMEKLQRALASGLSDRQVTENVRYYQEYVDTEIRKGRSEEEVLAGLGDPRLLAKSIIEANKRAGQSGGTNLNYDEEIVDGGSGRQTYSYTYGYDTEGERNVYEEDMAGAGRVFHMPGWSAASDYHGGGITDHRRGIFADIRYGADSHSGAGDYAGRQAVSKQKIKIQ